MRDEGRADEEHDPHSEEVFAERLRFAIRRSCTCTASRHAQWRTGASSRRPSAPRAPTCGVGRADWRPSSAAAGTGTRAGWSSRRRKRAAPSGRRPPDRSWRTARVPTRTAAARSSIAASHSRQAVRQMHRRRAPNGPARRRRAGRSHRNRTSAATAKRNPTSRRSAAGVPAGSEFGTLHQGSVFRFANLTAHFVPGDCRRRTMTCLPIVPTESTRKCRHDMMSSATCGAK